MLSIFLAIEIKKVLFVSIVTFRRNIAYIVNSFVVSLDVTVMINISQEIIKFLQKTLKTVYLH